MDKKTQGQIARERTIAGEAFAGLKSKRDNGDVFANFATMPKSPRAEDVFKTPDMPAERLKPVFETRRKRIFTKPSAPKLIEP